MKVPKTCRPLLQLTVNIQTSNKALKIYSSTNLVTKIGNVAPVKVQQKKKPKPDYTRLTCFTSALLGLRAPAL